MSAMRVPPMLLICVTKAGAAAARAAGGGIVILAVNSPKLKTAAVSNEIILVFFIEDHPFLVKFVNFW